MTTRELRFVATERSGEVSALLDLPERSRALLVLAHGAGAGMRHAFMESVVAELAARDIATFRYQFPYLERGGRRPDHQPILLATVRSAVTEAARQAGDLPLFAGGKSMGGRMTSLAQAAAPLAGVCGIVFFGFPLHPAGKPGVERAAHLDAVDLPMLFLQGTRDALAGLPLLTPICEKLAGREAAGARAQLHVVEAADHSFHVLERSGRTDAEVLAELADTAAKWMAAVASP